MILAAVLFTLKLLACWSVVAFWVTLLCSRFPGRRFRQAPRP